MATAPENGAAGASHASVRGYTRRKWALTGISLSAAAIAAAAGFAVQRGLYPDPPAGAGSASELDALWAAQLTDLGGQTVRFSRFKGQALVINFWASWCSPCLEEMPDFQKASVSTEGRKAVFVGIGIDYTKNMRPFADKLGITYTLLEAGAKGLDLVKAAGNTGGALPFTLILNRRGEVIMRKLGKMSYDELLGILAVL